MGLLRSYGAHVCMFLYAFTYAVNVSVLPILTQELNVDLLRFAWMQSWFSLVQLVGGPIMGRVSDIYGAHMTAGIGLASSSLMYLLMGMSFSAEWIFISRIPGLAMHSGQALQVITALVASEEERTTMLGRLSLAYGAGSVLGSACVGLVSIESSVRTIIVLDAVVAALAACVAWALGSVIQHPNKGTPNNADEEDIDEGDTEIEADTVEDEEGGADRVVTVKAAAPSTPGVNALEPKRMLRKEVVLAVVFRALSMAPQLLLEAVFPAILVSEFGLNMGQLSSILTLRGVCDMVLQGAVVGQLEHWLGARALQVCLGLQLVAALALSMITISSAPLMVAVIWCLLLPTSMLDTYSLSKVSAVSSKQDLGLTISITGSVLSVCELIGPPLATALMAWGSWQAAGSLTASVSIIANIYSYT